MAPCSSIQRKTTKAVRVPEWQLQFSAANSNVTLRDGGGTVLQEPLHKGNVVAVGLVDFRSVPLAKAVCADALKA